MRHDTWKAEHTVFAGGGKGGLIEGKAETGLGVTDEVGNKAAWTASTKNWEITGEPPATASILTNVLAFRLIPPSSERWTS